MFLVFNHSLLFKTFWEWGCSHPLVIECGGASSCRFDRKTYSCQSASYVS